MYFLPVGERGGRGSSVRSTQIIRRRVEQKDVGGVEKTDIFLGGMRHTFLLQTTKECDSAPISSILSFIRGSSDN